MNIKVVLLDLGGVVLKIDWKHPIAKLGLENDPTLCRLISTIGEWEQYDRYERNAISTEQFHQSLCKRLNRDLDLSAFTVAWNSLVEGPLDGVESLLEEVAGKAQLYALSNTNAAHMAHVVPTYPVLGYFRKIFTSCELGLRKPDPEIFKRVSDELHVSPAAMLFVDDNLINVEAARGAGLVAEQSVDSVARLREILKSHGVLT